MCLKCRIAFYYEIISTSISKCDIKLIKDGIQSRILIELRRSSFLNTKVINKKVVIVGNKSKYHIKGYDLFIPYLSWQFFFIEMYTSKQMTKCVQKMFANCTINQKLI